MEEGNPMTYTREKGLWRGEDYGIVINRRASSSVLDKMVKQKQKERDSSQLVGLLLVEMLAV
jgi:hypothetical protein